VNDQEFQNLITCPKRIAVKPKKDAVIQKGSEQYGFQLAAMADATQKFRVFLRKNTTFAENFSVGMDYLAPVGDDLCLVRFNGYHAHRNQVGDQAYFEDFHIHQATEEALSQGLKAENFASPTQDYRTFEEAIAAFWKHVNIQDDCLEHFPFLNNLTQLKLQFPQPPEQNA
jgi:hypothetical protein